MRLAYTSHMERRSKKVRGGANFVTAGRLFVTCPLPGADRVEVQTIGVVSVTGGDR